MISGSVAADFSALVCKDMQIEEVTAKVMI
jgi:hypothetical protein